MKVFTGIFRQIDPFLPGLLVIAAIFMFANLGNIYLWQDEASTATVAQNVLKTGLPLWPYKVTDLSTGNLTNLIVVNQTWLQFYIVALSFLLLGATTFTARLPFAIFGLGCIPLTYILAKYLSRDRLAARVSALILTFSVPFFLYMRQCRYHALAAFFSLLTILVYLRFVKRRKFSKAGFIFTAVALFHSNQGAFTAIMAALFIHYCLFHFDKRQLWQNLLILGTIFIFTFPLFMWVESYIRMSGVSQDASPTFLLGHTTLGHISLNHIRRQLQFYIRAITKYVIPAVFFLLTWLIARVWKKRFYIPPSPINREQFWLVLLVIFIPVSMFLFVEQRHFRYIVFLLPLFFILEGIFFAGWLKTPSRKILSVLILATLIFTNALMRPYNLKFRVFDFLYEITHDYEGPNEGVVKYLNAHAKPGQTVKVPYGDLPILFYVKGVNVVSKYDEAFIKDESYPEWIVYRRFWVPQGFLKSDYYKNIKTAYEEIRLIGYPDIKWGNRPDPGEHRYRTETDHPDEMVIIYKRKVKGQRSRVKEMQEEDNV